MHIEGCLWVGLSSITVNVCVEGVSVCVFPQEICLTYAAQLPVLTFSNGKEGNAGREGERLTITAVFCTHINSLSTHHTET